MRFAGTFRPRSALPCPFGRVSDRTRETGVKPPVLIGASSCCTVVAVCGGKANNFRGSTLPRSHHWFLPLQCFHIIWTMFFFFLSIRNGYSWLHYSWGIIVKTRILGQKRGSTCLPFRLVEWLHVPCWMVWRIFCASLWSWSSCCWGTWPWGTPSSAPSWWTFPPWDILWPGRWFVDWTCLNAVVSDRSHPYTQSIQLCNYAILPVFSSTFCSHFFQFQGVRKAQPRWLPASRCSWEPSEASQRCDRPIVLPTTSIGTPTWCSSVTWIILEISVEIWACFDPNTESPWSLQSFGTSFSFIVLIPIVTVHYCWTGPCLFYPWCIGLLSFTPESKDVFNWMRAEKANTV